MSTTSVSSLELQKWSSLKAHTSPSSSVEIPTCELGHAEHLQAPGFIHHLKPADGGPEAWKILVAAVILESLLWGTIVSEYEFASRLLT
jgi:hypothetical protein